MIAKSPPDYTSIYKVQSTKYNSCVSIQRSSLWKVSWDPRILSCVRGEKSCLYFFVYGDEMLNGLVSLDVSWVAFPGLNSWSSKIFIEWKWELVSVEKADKLAVQIEWMCNIINEVFIFNHCGSISKLISIWFRVRG